MNYLILFLWLVGATFTTGVLALSEDTVSEFFGKLVMCLFAWPFALGYFWSKTR